jgi:hypothetical protein
MRILARRGSKIRISRIGTDLNSFDMSSDAEFGETPIDRQLDDAQFSVNGRVFKPARRNAGELALWYSPISIPDSRETACMVVPSHRQFQNSRLEDWGAVAKDADNRGGFYAPIR